MSDDPKPFASVMADDEDKPFEPVAPKLPPDERTRQLEEISKSILKGQRRADNLVRWEAACPPGLRESDWSHERLSPYRAQIDRVLGHQLGKKGIIASGPTGRGKSRSMWQLMRRFSEDGLEVRFFSASDWFTSLQEQIRYGRDDARGWVETVAKRHVVFLDDYGQEALQTTKAEWAMGWFFRFLDIRVGEGLPLYLTTNLRSDEMVGRAGSIRGDPLVRRLLDLADPVSFETPEERAAHSRKR
jgi:DNA replication protein DnaC